jgi:cation transport ATPase
MVILGLAKGAVNSESLFFETSAMLLSFILLGKLLELTARRRASNAVAKLMNLRCSVAVFSYLLLTTCRCSSFVYNHAVTAHHISNSI